MSVEVNQRRLLVLYGSQTGCAQETSERIAREAIRRRFVTRVLPMDAYDVLALPLEPLVVFVASTTGQGDLPDNMQKFWRFLLRRSLRADSLSAMRAAVFGLGDSSYSRFNFAAKKLFNRLKMLGAQLILPRGDGDDQHPLGLDGALDPWLDQLWTQVDRLYPLQPGQKPITGLLPPLYEYHQSSEPLAVKTVVYDPALPCTPSNAFAAPIVELRRLTAADWQQNVLHIELSLEGSSLSYQPGDVVAMAPENPEEQVEAFAARVGLDLSAHLLSLTARTESDDRWAHVPCPIAIKDFLTRYMDICGTPKRYFFEVIAEFTESEIEQEKLREFSSAEGQADLRLYANSERRTYIEVLDDFRHVKLPLFYLLDLVPPIQPRYYSIASSLMAHPKQLHITVALVQYTTPLKRERVGLCSRWLANKQVGDRIHVWTKPGTFAFPKDPAEPVILVGPGTGVAPFRSYLQERYRLFQSSPDSVGPTALFFGCRHKEKDYLYGNEWKEYVERSFLPDWFSPAFSRDQPSKVYVQHRILERATLLYDWISNRNARIFLAGSSLNMPADVRDAFRTVLMQEGSMSEPEADLYLRQLDRAERYQIETWA
mmetsp:Transcript_28813/g.72502  ORF Transcript_28813/g.72502 Transcript_28813/m.72502 type:complete len:599 (+) Transcript_28813:171-1967(+)